MTAFSLDCSPVFEDDLWEVGGMDTLSNVNSKSDFEPSLVVPVDRLFMKESYDALEDGEGCLIFRAGCLTDLVETVPFDNLFWPALIFLVDGGE